MSVKFHHQAIDLQIVAICHINMPRVGKVVAEDLVVLRLKMADESRLDEPDGLFGPEAIAVEPSQDLTSVSEVLFFIRNFGREIANCLHGDDVTDGTHCQPYLVVTQLFRVDSLQRLMASDAVEGSTLSLPPECLLNIDYLLIGNNGQFDPLTIRSRK